MSTARMDCRLFWRPEGRVGDEPRHSQLFTIELDLDENNEPRRALLLVGSVEPKRAHVLGVDNLRAMLGDKAFEELRKELRT